MKLDSQTKGCSHDQLGPRDDVHAAGHADSRRWRGFGSAGRRIARRRFPSGPAPVGTASTRSPCWGAARCGMSRPSTGCSMRSSTTRGNAVFLVNGGDGELIRYDIGSGRTSRIGRRGSGPGEFGRPVWLEPHGPDSLLAYDMSLGRFSVFSRSGDFGRIFMLPGDGGRGRHVAAMTRMGARVWAALSLGTPPGLMGLETAPGTKARGHRGRSRSDRRGWCLEHGRPRPLTASGSGGPIRDPSRSFATNMPPGRP